MSSAMISLCRETKRKGIELPVRWLVSHENCKPEEPSVALADWYMKISVLKVQGHHEDHWQQQIPYRINVLHSETSVNYVLIQDA